MAARVAQLEACKAAANVCGAAVLIGPLLVCCLLLTPVAELPLPATVCRNKR